MVAGLNPITVEAATINMDPGDDLSDTIAAASPGDTINVPAGTFTEAAGMTISKNITIQGSGVGTTIVQAAASPATTGGDAKLFVIGSAADVYISEMTIRNGRAYNGDEGANIHVLGAQLTLDQVAVEGGRAYGGSNGGGVAITNGGTLTVTDSTFDDNQSDTYGGAIFLINGNLDIDGSTFTNSWTETVGGAIQAALSLGNTVSITNSTFSGNTVNSGEGGGIRVNFNGDAVVEIANNTITGNSAGANGGGLQMYAYSGEGIVNLVHNTIANNSAGTSGEEVFATANAGEGGALLVNSVNNIIYNSSSPVYASSGAVTLNRAGTILSDASMSGGGSNGNVDSTNPQLSALADNGGQVQTMSINEASPAADIGQEPVFTGLVSLPTTDARGVDRNDPADAGAYEVNTKILNILSPAANALSDRTLEIDVNVTTTLQAGSYQLVFDGDDTDVTLTLSDVAAGSTVNLVIDADDPTSSAAIATASAANIPDGVYTLRLDGVDNATSSAISSDEVAGFSITSLVPTEVYRFYNATTGAHLYTSSVAQRNRVMAGFPQFGYEGEAYAVMNGSDDTVTPVYRFYNYVTGAHFYTANLAQRNRVIANYPDYEEEGIAFYVFNTAGEGKIPVYRFYNASTRAHFYTSNEAQRARVTNNYPDFQYEGVAYYVPSN